MKSFKSGTIIQVILILTILLSSKSFAVSQVKKLQLSTPVLQIAKNLNLTVNIPHLLTFDEKIIRYKLENEKDFKTEILSNIFNNRQELLIKPLKNLNNKLTVWTESKIYNLSIEFEQNQELKIREVTAKSNALLEDTCGMTDFDLDSPPKSKEK